MSTSTISNPVARWIDHRLPVFTFLNHELNEYPTPKNLSYWWNFGSLAGITLIIMIITGITLRGCAIVGRTRVGNRSISLGCIGA